MTRWCVLTVLAALVTCLALSSAVVSQQPLTPTPAPAWNAPQPAPVVVPDVKPMRWQRFADRRERRAMGITFFSVRAKLAELQASGVVTEDMSSEVVSATVMQAMMAENPKAFEDIDWDKLFEFIMKIIEMIMSMFASDGQLDTSSIATILPEPQLHERGPLVPFVFTVA